MQKSTVGGILTIVAGALGLVASLIVLLVALFAPSIYNDPDLFGTSTINGDEFGTIVAVVYGVMGFIGLIISALGIVGGIFALQRKHWGWALAGAIAGCCTFLPVGVAAVVLVAMGKSEFVKAGAVPPRPQMGNLT